MAFSIEDVDDLAARFSACELPKVEWTHHAHLAVGAWHVDRYGRDEALARLRTGIRRLNDSHQTLNTATSGYHETITRAYVELLAQFLESCPPTEPLNARVLRLLGSPLADPKVLLRFYSPDRLMSVAARAAWLEPDVTPLNAAAFEDA